MTSVFDSLHTNSLSANHSRIPLPKQKYGNDMEKLGPHMAHIWEWHGKAE